MDKYTFIKLLKQSNDKLDILKNKEFINECDFNNKELIELLNTTLADEEKIALFEIEHFLNSNNYIKSNIIASISDENIKLKLLYDDKISSTFSSFECSIIIDSLGDMQRVNIIKDKDFLNKHSFDDFEIYGYIDNFENEIKTKLLNDKELISSLGLAEFAITSLISTLQNDLDKIKLMKIYDIKSSQIIKTCSVDVKKDFLLNTKFEDKYNISSILATFSINELQEFMAENRRIIDDYDVRVYDIFIAMSDENKQQFINNIESLPISLNEKKECIVVANNLNEKINFDTLSQELKKVLEIKEDKACIDHRIVIDWNKNIEEYRGLDRLISINPINYNKLQKEKLIQLLKICPKLSIYNVIGMKKNENFSIFMSTGSEYIEAEKWIDDLISTIPKEYDDFQKLAIVDNAIGKKISYSPDFETEIFNTADSRALWKIISCGYGVCNGIAAIEQYILSKVGINSEIIESDHHAFLKVKDIIYEDKEVTTLQDPTWNLSAQKYGYFPNNFCVSYDDIRKNDIDSSGIDSRSHLNDEYCKDATFSLNEDSLRNIYASVGLTNKDRTFPIRDLKLKSEEINKDYFEKPLENVKKQLLMFQEMYPDFAKSQNSSIKIISNVLLNHENFNFSSCVVSRVYKKDDIEKKPILYIHFESLEGEMLFFYAKSDSREFIPAEEEEFIENFECYDKDIESLGGVRPWEKVQEENQTNLQRKEKIIVSGGQER